MYWEKIDAQEPEQTELNAQVVEELRGELREQEQRLVAGFRNLGETAHVQTLDMFSKGEGAEWRWSLDAGKRKKGEALLWNEVDLLEGASSELFARLDRIPLFHWSDSLFRVVRELVSLLAERFGLLLNLVEAADTEQRRQTSFERLLSCFSAKQRLDPKLSVHLREGKERLVAQSAQYETVRSEYLLLAERADQEMEQLRAFRVLPDLDTNDQNGYVNLARLLRILELYLSKVPKEEGIFVEKMKQALHEVSHMQRAIQIFENYFFALQKAFFQLSRAWKYSGGEQKEGLLERLRADRKELLCFNETLLRERKFILASFPDPYVGACLGFTDWTVAAEPVLAKRVLRLIYFAQDWDDLLRGLEVKMEAGMQRSSVEEDGVKNALREMSRPLLSKHHRRQAAEGYVNALDQLDEIGSGELATVRFMGEALRKGMRLDRVDQNLHLFPRFHRIFALHQGLVERFEDPSHQVRMEHFRALQERLSGAIQKGDIYTHEHEIELDLAEMKRFLQDFLAAIQRAHKEKETDLFLVDTVSKYQNQLMDYQYLFGSFFHQLLQKGGEHDVWRPYFAFVDRYLEAAERLLSQMGEGK